MTLPPSNVPFGPVTQPDPLKPPARGTRSTTSGDNLGAPRRPAGDQAAAVAPPPSPKAGPAPIAKPTPPANARAEATKSKTLIPSPLKGRTAPKPVAPVAKPPTPVAFPPPELAAKCEALISRYPARVAALIPILHLAQRHFSGWISPEVEAGIAKYLGCSDQHVRGVVTFYTMFNTKPVGRHHVQVCRTLSCWLRGAGGLTRLCKEKIGLAPGETGKDLRYSVSEVECLGLCEVAPAIFINDDPHVHVTPGSLAKLLDEAK